MSPLVLEMDSQERGHKHRFPAEQSLDASGHRRGYTLSGPCACGLQPESARGPMVICEVEPAVEDIEIRSARRAVCDALHNMHYDQRIIVDMALGQKLEAAWAVYDATIRGSKP